MSENEKNTEMEKFLKEIETVEDKLRENFGELKYSLQKIFACECEEPHLTEKEHSYLSSIIKPFRDKVTYIGKLSETYQRSFIEIGIERDMEITLPSFLDSQIYLGMETDKKYSIEELGL